LNLLAVDTVTEYCSVALALDGQVSFREVMAYQSHTEQVLPMIDELLTDAGVSLQQLDAIVLDRGPGSFTGLRIGAGVVQGLALGAELPVILASSLQTLAQGCFRQTAQTQVLAAIDARQGEIYWGCFHVQDGLMVLHGEENIDPPLALAPPDDAVYYGTGTAFDTFAKELENNPRVRLCGYAGKKYPLAQDMLPYATRAWQQQAYVDAREALPVYLRDKVATPPTR